MRPQRVSGSCSGALIRHLYGVSMLGKRSRYLEPRDSDDRSTLAAKEIISIIEELYPDHELFKVIRRMREILDEHTRPSF